MSLAVGLAYFFSIFVLTAVVAGVYSAAQDAFLPPRQILRRALKRAGKLLGVLLVLAIAVHFLSKMG